MAIASPHSWEIFSGRLLPCADHLAAPVEGLRAALERLLHEAIAKPHKIRKYMQGPGRRILSRQPPGRRARTLAQHGRADGGEEVLRRGDLAPGVAVGFQPENGVSCRGCNAGSEASEAGLSILKEFLNRRFRVESYRPLAQGPLQRQSPACPEIAGRTPHCRWLMPAEKCFSRNQETGKLGAC